MHDNVSELVQMLPLKERNLMTFHQGNWWRGGN